MNSLTRLLWMGLFLTMGARLMASDFEGKITISAMDMAMGRAAGTGTTPAQLMSFSVKGKKMRMETPMAIMITDIDKKQVTALMPQMKKYSIMSITDEMAQAGKALEAVTEKTGRTATILGYKCFEYKVAGSDGSVTEIWTAQDLGTWLDFGGTQLGERYRAESGIPLLSIARDKKGAEIMRMEVTKVERIPVADSLFAIPSGYTEMKMKMRR